MVTSDLKGSTALGERLDPESLREVMTTYIDEMSAVFESHGGRIEKIIGDAIVAVFGLPRARDDDALRAVEAATETQRALASLNERLDARWGVRLTVRTGVASGEVLVGEASAGQHVLTGTTMQVATRMEQNAPSQEVLLSESTYEAVREAVEVEPIGTVTAKGSDEPLEAFRLISVTERDATAAVAGAGDTGTGRVCGVCGAENPPEFRHCGTCGATLATRTVAGDTRKTVTIVFADPKPTTPDGAPPSPEALRDVMSRYFAGMQRALDRHGATVEKFIGDAVMAVFGLPIRHEDDALRAVRAARDMQQALPDLNAAFEAEWGITLHNHIGVNTGEVVAGDASLGQRLVTGDTVNVAARLEQAAGPREVLLGDLTYRLVRDAVQVEPVEPLTLKGKSEPVPAYRLVSISDAAQAVQRRQDAPMVGREHEMEALGNLFRTAVGERRCRMATVVGDAGVGKSRLIAEMTAGLAREALVIHGRCLPYGEGITFWPLREATREAAGIGNDDAQDEALQKLRERITDQAVADRLASVIGLSVTPYPVPEVFWAARRLLEELARERPLLFVIDDIHWAEATFLELITGLISSVEDSSVLLLCSSRHELLDRQADWATGEGSLRLVLQPLTDADAGRVVEHLLGGTGIADEVRGRILTAAAGNPLFVEQLLSMLIDDGSLRRVGDRWEQAGDLTRLQVPPSIQALLAARLDLLPAEERGVIEPASVIGQVFAQMAVTALVNEDLSADVPTLLSDLDQKQLVQPNPGGDADEAAYRFQHLLVRDAAYGGLLKRARASLHERFVNWAEEMDRRMGRGLQFEELQGYHLEQAYHYLAELGTLDDHARELGVRASRKLASAGRRAMARGDMPAAANLLRRAAATRDDHDPERQRLLPDLGEALAEQGEFEEAERVLLQAIAGAEERGDEILRLEASLGRMSVQLYSSEEAGWTERALAAVEDAIPVFERAGYHAGLARANRILVAVDGSALRFGPMSQAALQVIAHARAAGDPRVERRGAMGYAQAALWGPTPVPDAIGQIEQFADAAGDDRQTQSLLRTWLAQLYAMRGDVDLARRTYAAASDMLKELGSGLAASSSSTELAQIELESGDPARAEEALRRDDESLKAIGEKYIRSYVLGLLGRVLASQRRFEEVGTVSHELEQIADGEDVAAQDDWRSLRAMAIARDGDVAQARQLLDEAVERGATTDYVAMQAETQLRVADVARVAGDDAAADAATATALRLYREKGAVASARKVETLQNG